MDHGQVPTVSGIYRMAIYQNLESVRLTEHGKPPGEPFSQSGRSALEALALYVFQQDTGSAHTLEFLCRQWFGVVKGLFVLN